MKSGRIITGLVMVVSFSSLANYESKVSVDTSVYEEKSLEFSENMTVNFELINIVPKDKDKYNIVVSRINSERTESPRVCQRLNNLRNWNYEKIKSLYIRIS